MTDRQNDDIFFLSLSLSECLKMMGIPFDERILKETLCSFKNMLFLVWKGFASWLAFRYSGPRSGFLWPAKKLRYTLLLLCSTKLHEISGGPLERVKPDAKKILFLDCSIYLFLSDFFVSLVPCDFFLSCIVFIQHVYRIFFQIVFSSGGN